MAMLAERRQKVKWVLNPRQTAWSSDSNKFGQKYLEKLGWKSGQGIGANLQGCTEHIKVSVRNDNRGVGFKGVPEDVLPHQNNFSDLLAQLASNGHSIEAESNVEKSLEAKSRRSKARVHYHKFTRSKDLTVYSQKDLACILGKPTKPNKAPVEEQDSTLSESNFIQRGDMHAYFTKKMKHNAVDFVKENVTNVKTCDFSEDSNSYTGFGFSNVCDNSTSSEQLDKEEKVNEFVKKVQKKVKKHRESGEETHMSGCPEVEFSNSLPVTDAADCDSHMKKSRKKRKRSCAELSETEDNLIYMGTCNTEFETRNEIEGKVEKSEKERKKQKKINHVNVTHEESPFPELDHIKDQETAESECINKSGKQKKKTQGEATRRLDEVSFWSPCNDNEEQLSKKKLQRKHSLRKNVEASCVDIGFDQNEDLSKNLDVSIKGRVFLEKSTASANKNLSPITVGSNKLQVLETEVKCNEKIKKRRKKLKNNDQCIEVRSNEEDGVFPVCPVSSKLNENVEESHDKLRKRKKKHKRDKVLDKVEHDRLQVPDCTQNLLSSEVNTIEKSKKLTKKQKNYDEALVLSEVSKCSRKKRKREAKDYIEMYNSDNFLPLIDTFETAQAVKNDKPNENAELLRSKVKNIAASEPNFCGFVSDKKNMKHTRCSQPPSNVLLASSQRKSDTVNCVNDRNVHQKNYEGKLGISCTKKCLKQTEVGEEQIGCTINSEVNALNSNEDLCDYVHQVKSETLLVLYRGVKYVNGISEHNHRLPRKCWYSNDAMKTIPQWERKDIFDGFPGSNIEKLSYG